MSSWSVRSFAFILLLLFGLSTSGSAIARNYVLATATVDGTYYPVGVAIDTLTKVKLLPKKKISLSAVTSAGSRENLTLLRQNKAQFAILQGLYGAWAWNGTGAMKASGKQKDFRSITMLWQDVDHFVVASESVKSGDLDDLANLQGRGFSIGEKDSGAEGSGRFILNSQGIDPDSSFKLVNMDYRSSSSALVSGEIAGMYTPGGAPVKAVKNAFSSAASKVTLLNVTDQQLSKVNGEQNIWTRYTIPANTYPGQESVVNTIAQPNFLAVDEDVDDDTVYEITKAIYQYQDFLNKIHDATRDMSLEKAIVGLPVPLHPGAIRFYREQGIKIPKVLIDHGGSFRF